MYTSVDQLKKDIEVFKKELASKFDGSDGKRYLQLCGGTGCLAALLKLVHLEAVLHSKRSHS